MRRWTTGLLLGVALTAALLAVLAAADAALGIGFLAYGVFDLLVRALPGELATAGVEALVATLEWLDLSLREASKTAEQALAVALVLGLGAAAGMVGYAVRSRAPLRTGVLTGLGIGAPLTAAAVAVGHAASAPAALTLAVDGTAWLAWGAVLGLARRRLHDPAVHRVDRRRFVVQLVGATATVTVSGSALAAALRPRDEAARGVAVPLPPRDLVPAPGTRPEITPVAEHYRIDIDTRPPVVDGDRWRLVIDGLVDRPARLSLDALRARFAPRRELRTLSCISNPVAGPLIGTTEWTGVPLRDVLAEVGVRPEARYARILSVDGFHEVVDLDLVRADPRVMLTYAWDRRPLPADHGFPLRISIPDRYGMKQPKWIERIELLPDFVAGYWVERGWDRDALVKQTSVIDTVAVDEAFARDGATHVPVGGIAYAGARGISRVEVRVDDGPWQAAALARPLSPTSWVLWRWDWPFTPGPHRLTVRSFDGEGRAQIVAPSPPHPGGATGLHQVDVAG